MTASDDARRMHVVLLSGGSGKRLWPLSNQVRSKQFLKVLKNHHGEEESMIQRVYRQLESAGLADSVVVAAGAGQRDQIRLQLGKDIDLVLEPERRDTYPAIMLSCAYLKSVKGAGDNDTVVVMPVDAFAEDRFFEKILDFPKVMEEKKSSLVLMGVRPSEALENLGYIVPKESHEISQVESFKEKPDRNRALDLIDAGALWNCGVFGFALGHALEMLKARHGEAAISFDYLRQEYGTLKKTSFDYEIVESQSLMSVMRYEGMWKDLGTWNALIEEMGDNSFDNVLKDEKSQSSYVINEQNLPILVSGVEDCVIVSTYDGILVTGRQEASNIKALVEQVDRRPMFERKRWGRYTVLDHSLLDNGMESLTKKLYIDQGCSISYQYHMDRTEIWTILSGEGVVLIEGKESLVEAGSVVTIKCGVKHAVKALTDLEMIEVQLGTRVDEADIFRVSEDWI